MADTNEIKKLELRIVELEKKLELAANRSGASKLTNEELQTYAKVRDVLAADYGDFCGINDCFRCIVFRCGVLRCNSTLCVQRCVNECTCGPCNIGAYGSNLGGFTNLGG